MNKKSKTIENKCKETFCRVCGGSRDKNDLVNGQCKDKKWCIKP